MATKFNKFNINTKRALTAGTLALHEAIAEGSPFQTGTLRRSWTWRIENDVGIVGTNVPYAAIQNYGGIIKTRNKEYLTFQIRGKWVRVQMVQIPAQNYIENSINAARENIANALSRNLFEA